MRLRRLSIFALASLLVIATGAQSAFAFTWTSNSGYDVSNLATSGGQPSPGWSSSINQNVGGMTLNTIVSWGNTWNNAFSQSTYYGWQWSSVILTNYGAYGQSYTSPSQIASGSRTSVTSQARVYYIPYSGYSDAVNLNHRFEPNGYAWLGTSYLSAQMLTTA
jgi:hypothetical protein